MYAKYIKRFLDFLLSLSALLILSPLLLILVIIGIFVMKGNPFFVQPRPGKKGKDGREKIFNLIKYRTMSNAKDKNGNLLPDEKRLNRYGRFLRSTSLDELPELFNIVKGDMSLVGPRPQLVRDMVFMSEKQRTRHTVRPGLTGLAQISGRNGLSWEKKFSFDLQYIEKITLGKDIKIIWKTLFKVFIREGISQEGMSTAEDFGDYLLHKKEISQEEYTCKQEEARALLNR